MAGAILFVAAGYMPLLWAATACPVPAIGVLPAQTGQPSAVEADHVSLQKGIATAKGDARLTDNGQALEAPYMRYDRNTSQADAHGGLAFYKPGMFLKAKSGSVNIDKHTGLFDQTQYVLTTAGGRGRATTVRSRQDKHYRLDQASYTTCDLASPTWYLTATHVNLNRASGRGSAYNAVMHLYGLPIFYSPYFNFPIDNRRHTGFLAPLVGQSSRSGVELAWPFYINIAPNYDATLIPRYFSKRGFQLGAQGRYLFRHTKGELDGQIMPNDRVYGDRRSFVHFQHRTKFNQYVGFQADYNRASDPDYFDDFDQGPGGTDSTQLERAAQLNFATTGARFDLLVQKFQSLNSTGNSTSFYNVLNHNPYTRLPRARLALLSPTAPFRLGLNAEFTNFIASSSTGIDAQRWNVRPRLLWGLDHGGWFINSEADYDYTHYDLSNLSSIPGGNTRPDSINRGIPSFKLDSGLRFSRAMHNGWVQTFEPRMQYLYVGYQNQSNIPIFDSGISDLHYDSLFADNRFSGIDRIGDANQLTLGATSRIYSPQSGRTLAKLSIGRVTSFRDLRVKLPNTGITGYSNSGSDYVGSLSLHPIEPLTARGAVEYDPSKNHIDRGLAEVEYATQAGYGAQVGYRYYRGYRPARRPGFSSNGRIILEPGEYQTLKQIAVSAYAPITDRLKVVAGWTYSLEIHRDIETLAGVEYSTSCCLAARLSWRRYVHNRLDNHDHAIVFQLVFRGLGKFGKAVDSFVRGDVFDGINSNRTQDSFNTIRDR